MRLAPVGDMHLRAGVQGGARGRGGRVSSTVTREVEDIEDGDAEEDVMSMAGALEFEAVENDKDGAGE
eukprot:gene12632-14932_t